MDEHEHSNDPAHLRAHYIKSLSRMPRAPLMNKPERPAEAIALYADLLVERRANVVAVEQAVTAHLLESKYFPTPAELFERVLAIMAAQERRRAEAHPDARTSSPLDNEARRMMAMRMEAYHPEEFHSRADYDAFTALTAALSWEYTNTRWGAPATMNSAARAEYIFRHPAYAALCMERGYDPHGRIDVAGHKLLAFPQPGAPDLAPPRTPPPDE